MLTAIVEALLFAAARETRQIFYVPVSEEAIVVYKAACSVANIGWRRHLLEQLYAS